MVFGKKDESHRAAAAEEKERRRLAAIAERDAASKVRAERQERERADKERARFLASPQGQARTAFGEGFLIFQVSFDLAETRAHVVALTGAFTTSKANDPTKLLNAIALEGWDIVAASSVFVETGSESRDKFAASGQQIAVKGKVVGYYTFRRCEASRADDPGT